MVCLDPFNPNSKEVRVRIGPSPTGVPHVGTGYVSLFNYAFCRQFGGKFILRIEDTDQKRSTIESEQAILNSIKWLGLKWDEGPDIGGPYGPYRQSERLDIYQKHVDKLLQTGNAYFCTCSTERLTEIRQRQIALKQPTSYDGTCREYKRNSGVVRLKVPKYEKIEFFDLLRGNINIESSEIDDQVLLKSDGFPTYHLANVVDDYLMRITHVIRGEEWISSTPKHILLYRFFGWDIPVFVHLPLLRNFDKSKVSKRKNPVSLEYFKEAGFLPEVMLNFLGLMAFSFEDGREIFSLDDFISNFKIERISLGGPVFDLRKLLWLNGKYLREKYSNSDMLNYIQKQVFSTEYLTRIIPLIKDRIEKSEDFFEYADFFFKNSISFNLSGCHLINFNDKDKLIKTCEFLIDELDSLKSFEGSSIENLIRLFCDKHKIEKRELFMFIRLAVTGKRATPPLFETLSVLGRNRCVMRLRAFLGEIKNDTKNFFNH